MKIGANYTPSQGWFHSWLDLDIDATRRDFEGIAQLGLDHVRLFPLWPLLQPNRGLVRPRALDDVVSVVRAAGEFDLEVTVDALNGHLSSYDFLPSWVITWHASNLFTDPLVEAGQTDLISQLATRLREEPNATGMTVARDLYSWMRPKADEEHLMKVSRIATIVLGLSATAMAVDPPGSIITLYGLRAVLLTTAFFLPVYVALFWTGLDGRAVLLAIAGGGIVGLATQLNGGGIGPFPSTFLGMGTAATLLLIAHYLFFRTRRPA